MKKYAVAIDAAKDISARLAALPPVQLVETQEEFMAQRPLIVARKALGEAERVLWYQIARFVLADQFHARGESHPELAADRMLEGQPVKYLRSIATRSVRISRRSRPAQASQVPKADQNGRSTRG